MNNRINKRRLSPGSIVTIKVRQMIERQKEKYGWEFIFLGANIDAVKTAEERKRQIELDLAKDGFDSLNKDYRYTTLGAEKTSTVVKNAADVIVAWQANSGYKNS